MRKLASLGVARRLLVAPSDGAGEGRGAAGGVKEDQRGSTFGVLQKRASCRQERSRDDPPVGAGGRE